MIGTRPAVTVPLLSDTMATVVAKTAASLNLIADSVADLATPAGLNVAANLSFQGNWATSVGGVVLVDGNAPTAAGGFYYHSGEFYLIDSTSVVQVTSLGHLNAAGFGGIGGDYGAAGVTALVSYNNATSQYRFYKNPATPTWADLVVNGLVLEGASGTTRLLCDSSVVAPQDLKFGPFSTAQLVVWDGTKFIPNDTSTSWGGNLHLGGDVFVNDVHRATGHALPISTLGSSQTNTAYGLGFIGPATGAWSWQSQILPLVDGDKVLGMSCHFTAKGAGTASMKLHQLAPGLSDTVVHTDNTTTTGAFDFVGTAFAATISAGFMYYMEITGPASGDEVTIPVISFNHP